jgi:hypothetical protein
VLDHIKAAVRPEVDVGYRGESALEHLRGLPWHDTIDVDAPAVNGTPDSSLTYKPSGPTATAVGTASVARAGRDGKTATVLDQPPERC